MSLSIGPLESSEMSEYIRMQLNAFPSMTARILYAPSPETAEQTRFQNLELLKNNPEVYFQKTFDPATGDILSCAKWKIYPNGREEAKMDSPKLGSSQEPAVGWEAEAKKTFHHSLSRYLRDFMGTQPFYHLDMLMTDPRFSRRGAAQKIIDWGIAEADSKQLPIYLESSLMARSLYERNGFQRVQDFTMDLANYGGVGAERVTIMIRMPKST
ncbi:uncharacterized protein N7529_004667 [Penicillium soppii]|uniref:uncharacterized protein n=1 Tax=Penicillium soppii TaxID=69789 RepID=UPI002547F57C|nr:uncharacterized protein N7529_004667 [Penicillium soppii]KAJ5872314.1 hypothetical protein N7529_004667 [Penicillium soppii]